MAKQDFPRFSVEETFKILHSNKKGLSRQEAENRLKRHGPNKLPEEKKAPWFFLFFNQFKSTLIYILLGAALISFFLRDLIDMYVILVAVLVNVVIGFIQEYKATRAMEKLEKVITFYALLVRDGQEKEIKAENLVPGDIVLLKAGDKIPADGRLISVKNLEINEASLTGESIPVKKTAEQLKDDLEVTEQKNMVFMGTVVLSGAGELVVTNTGINTQLGKIATLIEETPEGKTPFQKKLDNFSRLLGYLTLGVSIVILIVGVLEGIGFVQIFATSVAIAVSAIPEGLVIAVTAILAVGMQRILKQKALVKKLVAAETLGSTTVICTDKTGTLTEGDMRVSKLVTYDHDFSAELHQTISQKIKESMELTLLFKIGVLSNNAVIQNPQNEFAHWKMIGSPTEKSLLHFGARLGFFREKLEKEEPRLDEIPFDSNYKYMLTLHKQEKGSAIYLKGAPEKVLKMSKRIQIGNSTKPLSSAMLSKFQGKFEKMSKNGLRILALGYQLVKPEINNLNNSSELKALLNNFIFVGLIGIKDPLRKEAKETIKLCKQAGIKIVMITGDHKLTAQAIARELGLKSNRENILEGKDLAQLSSKELARRVKDISVYARVTPKDKLQIIDAWQERGGVVAMTGDGVNDAPALKSADIGVALGSGSDVAKETADLIILDDNFKTIVAAVREGRIIFDNIKKVILYLLSDSFTEIILIAGAIIISGISDTDFPLPLLASQILWVNLANDSFPSIALTIEPGEEEVMAEPPAGKKRLLFTKEMTVLTVVISFVSGFGNLLLYWFLVKYGFAVEEARTIIFANVGIDSLLYIFSIKSMRYPIFSRKLFSNRYLIYAVLFGFILQLLAIYFTPFQNFLYTVPLSLNDWLIVAFSCFAVITLVEIIKYSYVIKGKTQKQRLGGVLKG